MDKLKAFESEKIGKLIVKFTLPAMVAMLAGAINNIVDRIFVGQEIGSDALSGVALTFPIVTILTAITIFIAAGTAVSVSLKLGEKQTDEAELIIGNGFMLSLGSSIVLTTLLYVFMDPILTLFGGEGTPLMYARQYMEVYLFATVFQMTGYALNHSIRATGNPIVTLLTIFSGSVINIILNPVFIVVLQLGIKGSALATLISQVVFFLWAFLYFRSKRNSIKLRYKYFKLKGEIIKKISAIGLPSLFLQGLMSLTLIVANNVFLEYGGTNGLAIVAIIGVVYSLFHMLMAGIIQGITPIIGYNYGAKNIDRVFGTIKIAMLIGSTICILGFIAIFFFNRPIISLFTKDDHYLMTEGAVALKYTFLAIPLFGFSMIAGAYFSGTGIYKTAIGIHIVRISLLTIPLLIVLPHYFGFYGCIAAFPVADVIASFIISGIMYSEWKKLRTEAYKAK